MNPIKGLVRWAAVPVISFSAWAVEPVLSPLTPLEVPPLTIRGGKTIANASVGVSGTNAVLVWTEPVDDPSRGFPQITNIVLTRIGASKEPLDDFWRTVTPGFYGPERQRVLPSDNGFFLLYKGKI